MKKYILSLSICAVLATQAVALNAPIPGETNRPQKSANPVLELCKNISDDAAQIPTQNDAISNVCSVVQNEQKPEDNPIYMYFMDLLSSKKEQLQKAISQKGAYPIPDLSEPVYNSVLRAGGIGFFRNQSYSVAQITDMYYSQSIPATLNWVGEYLEASDPEYMLEELNKLYKNLPSPDERRLLPKDQTKRFSFGQTYFFIWALLETSKQVENF